MAFDIENLHSMFVAGSFTYWYYDAKTDTNADLEDEGYFNAAPFNNGDVILANLADRTQTVRYHVDFIDENVNVSVA
jgi:hypothetical protein